MPRIKTDDFLDRIAKRDFKSVKLRAVSGGAFVMLLECENGVFIHEKANGEIKEYPNIDNALNWLLRRAGGVNEVIIDISYWRLDN